MDLKNLKIQKNLKKLAETDGKEPNIRFRKVTDKRGNYIRIELNKPLLRSMKDNKVFTFKLLFSPNDNRVALRFDNSSNAIDLTGRRTRSNGDIHFMDKFVTATTLPLMKEHKVFTYECKFIKEQIIYIFKLKKKQ